MTGSGRLPEASSLRRGDIGRIGLSVAILLGLTMCSDNSTSAAEEVIVPQEGNEYFTPDIRLGFRFDEHFRAGTLSTSQMTNAVQFMYDWRDRSSIGSDLIAEPDGVVVRLSVSKKDPVPGLLGMDDDGEGGYLSGFKPADEDLYGLVLKANRQVEVEGFPEEKLLMERSARPSFYIHCEPSGNDYPSFCTLRWQDFLAVPGDSNAGLLADLVFREENLAHWREIKQAAVAILGERAQVLPRE